MDTKKKYLFAIAYLILLIISCDNSKHESYSKSTLNTLQNWYDEETGLYKTTSWWNAANVITAIIDFSKITGSKDYLWVIDNTFEKCKEFEVQMPDPKDNWICKNYINDYYDDEGWWVLAWIEAYRLIGDEKYLIMARTTFEDMVKGWDNVCGGGIYWKKPNIGKSAVQNELFMLAAIRLHNLGGGIVKDKTYLNWAEETWKWFEKSGMIKDNYLVDNGLNKKCEVSSGSFYTYNQGVILSALVELSKVKMDESLLDLAHNIAHSTIKNMVYDDGILRDLKEPNLNGDASQFKGIFMRHLGFLHSQSPKKIYKDFILKNANSIWNNARDKNNNEIGVVWNTKPKKRDASRQSSALDAFNSAMLVSKD